MRASRRSRSATAPPMAAAGNMTLRATGRRSETSSALNTAAIPPRPHSRSISYSPASTRRSCASSGSGSSASRTTVAEPGSEHRHGHAVRPDRRHLHGDRDVMRYASCGSDVPSGLRYCGRCGNEVTDPGSATVVLEAEEPDPLLAQLRRVLAGEYEIERECGRGGMAAVFKALDVSLRRPVALKVMFPAAAIGGAVAERLRREARMAAGLDHPNIVPIYRVAQAGGVHYIVMKFIEGDRKSTRL